MSQLPKPLTEPRQASMSLPPASVYGQMLVEAESVVQQNWLDVVIHDREKLESYGPGHAFAWCISPIGSKLMPLFCPIDRTDETSSLQLMFLKYQSDFVKYGAGAKDFMLSSFFYIVLSDQLLQPIDLEELVRFAFSGVARLAKSGGFVYAVQVRP